MPEPLNQQQALIVMANAISALSNALSQALELADREGGFEMTVEVSIDSDTFEVGPSHSAAFIVSRTFDAIRRAAEARKEGA